MSKRKGGNRPIEHKIFPFEVKQIDTESDPKYAFVKALVSTTSIDRTNEIVLPSAFTKTMNENKEKGFPVLLDHDKIIGRTYLEEIKAEGLLVEFKLSKRTQSGLETIALIEDEILQSMSFGYKTIEDSIEDRDDISIRIIKELLLLEVSVVAVPANQDARIMAIKSVVPFQDLPLALLGRGWDAKAAKARIKMWAGGDNWQPDKYKLAHVYFNEDEPEKVSSYKLLIADIIEGELQVVPRALFVAASILTHTSEESGIGQEDILKAQKHVAKYYSLLERKAPWEKGHFDLDEITALTAHEIERINDIKGSITPETKRYVDQTIEALSSIPVSPDEPLKKSTLPADTDLLQAAKMRTEQLNKRVEDYDSRRNQSTI